MIFRPALLKRLARLSYNAVIPPSANLFPVGNPVRLQAPSDRQRIRLSASAGVPTGYFLAAFLSVAATPLAVCGGEAAQQLRQQYDLSRAHVDTDARGRVDGRLFLLGKLVPAPASPPEKGFEAAAASARGVADDASPATGSKAISLAARAFIHQQQALLGLADPDRELQMTREIHTPHGSHLHYRRHVGDLPLAAANLSLHFDKDGNMVGVTGQMTSPSSALERKAQDRGTPTETERQAVKNAVIEGIKKEPGNSGISAATVVFNDRNFDLIAREQHPQLVWQGKAQIGLTEWRFEVDDNSGDVITLYQEARTLY